jgi:hypothetical protein
MSGQIEYASMNTRENLSMSVALSHDFIIYPACSTSSFNILSKWDFNNTESKEKKIRRRNLSRLCRFF